MLPPLLVYQLIFLGREGLDNVQYYQVQDHELSCNQASELLLPEFPQSPAAAYPPKAQIQLWFHVRGKPILLYFDLCKPKIGETHFRQGSSQSYFDRLGAKGYHHR